VKKSALLPFGTWLSLLFILSSSAAHSHNGDPWVKKYRASQNAKSMLLLADSASESENLGKFFDGFAVGASAGLALFHGTLAEYNMFAPLSDFSTYYKFGWRIYASREMYKGLGLKLLFEAGSLEGGRAPGLQSPIITFRSEYRTLALAAKIDVLGALLGEDSKPRKTYLDAEIGIGITWFRALSFWTGEDERVIDFVGYTVTDNNPPTQRYTVDEKTNAATALNIPVGFTFGYRVNYKTDVTFSYTLNNLATDRLDSRSRDWSANDKYSYFGLGLRYNFNRSKDDYPPKKIKDKDLIQEAGNEKWKLFGSKKEDVSPNEVNLDGPIESRKSNKVLPTEQNKDMDEIRMQMFELQLKLFQMQYLLEGAGTPQSATPSPGKK
jgi:hypothetical protein